MRLKAAKTNQKGATFAVVLVEKSVIENRENAFHIVRHFQGVFPDTHIVLAYEKPGEPPLYFGRPDIANKLQGLAMASIAWTEYDLPDPA